MKTIIRNSRLASFVFVLLLSTQIVIAAGRDSSINGNPVELKLVGRSNDLSTFQLDIRSGWPENDYLVIIRDIYGTNYFRESFKTPTYSKKFQFNMDELGDDTLELEVYNRRTKQSIVYTINKHVKLVEEILVSKL